MMPRALHDEITKDPAVEGRAGSCLLALTQAPVIVDHT